MTSHSFHPSGAEATLVPLQPSDCLGPWNNDTDLPLPSRDDYQASQRNKNHQEHELLSHRDPVMVIIVVGAVVTTIIFSLQLVSRIRLDYTSTSIQYVMGNHYHLSKS